MNALFNFKYSSYHHYCMIPTKRSIANETFPLEIFVNMNAIEMLGWMERNARVGVEKVSWSKKCISSNLN